MKPDDMFIAGLGTYLPEPFSVQNAVEQGLCDAALMEISGWVSARVAGDMMAPEMAVRAGNQALARSGIDLAEFRLLLHTSVTHQGPDGWSEQYYVQRHTIGGNALAVNIRESCQGMTAALELACAYLVAGPDQGAAMVTAADNWGHPLVDRWRSQPTAILGDAGTAMVLSRRRGFARVLSIASSSAPELEHIERGDEPLFPPASSVGRPLNLAERTARLVGGMVLDNIFQATQASRTKLVHQVIDEAGVALAEISKVCIAFSTGPRYVRYVLEPIGFRDHHTDWVFRLGRTIGHTGGGDPFIGLDHLLETGAVGPGDLVMIIGDGWVTGRTCAVIEVLTPPERSQSV